MSILLSDLSPDLGVSRAALSEAREKNLPLGRDLLAKYVQSIQRYPLISLDEEVRLGGIIQDKIRQKCLDAEYKKSCQSLVNANLRLVVTIAGDYRRTGFPMLDMIQDGNMGLMRAAEKYDPTFETKFSYFAAFWIRQAITHGFARQRVLRVGYDTLEEIRRLEDAESNGIDPRTVLEKPEKFDQLRLIQDRVLRAVSLQTPLSRDQADGATLQDILPDRDADDSDFFVSLQESGFLLEFIEQLPEKEADYVRMYFGFPPYLREHTFQEIADKYKISKQAVSALLKRAYPRWGDKLREFFF